VKWELVVELLVQEAELMAVLVELHCFAVPIAVSSHHYLADPLPLVVEVQQTAVVHLVTERSVLEAED